jgi:hypothetical protein
LLFQLAREAPSFLVPWSSGHDSWVTSRQRWFESSRDHSRVCRCFGSIPLWYGGGPGSIPGRTSEVDMGAHVRWGATLPCKQRVVGSIPTVSTASGLLVQRQDTGIARRQSGFESPAVHYTGSWSKGKTPAWRAGNPGSIPGGSTCLRKVAGYGSPGLFAKQRARKSVRVQIPCLPLVPRW